MPSPNTSGEAGKLTQGVEKGSCRKAVVSPRRKTPHSGKDLNAHPGRTLSQGRHLGLVSHSAHTRSTASSPDASRSWKPPFNVRHRHFSKQKRRSQSTTLDTAPGRLSVNQIQVR